MLSITSVGLLLDSQELRCPREDTKAPRPRRHQPAWLPGKGTVSNCPGAFFGPVSRLPDGSSGVLAGGAQEPLARPHFQGSMLAQRDGRPVSGRSAVKLNSPILLWHAEPIVAPSGLQRQSTPVAQRKKSRAPVGILALAQSGGTDASPRLPGPKFIRHMPLGAAAFGGASSATWAGARPSRPGGWWIRGRAPLRRCPDLVPAGRSSRDSTSRNCLVAIAGPASRQKRDTQIIQGEHKSASAMSPQPRQVCSILDAQVLMLPTRSPRGAALAMRRRLPVGSEPPRLRKSQNWFHLPLKATPQKPQFVRSGLLATPRHYPWIRVPGGRRSGGLQGGSGGTLAANSSPEMSLQQRKVRSDQFGQPPRRSL
ncbi:hypothetical protein ACCO45_008388 [Purpureocillium lilacinum]|uniref:Uncharacterized protein n=1 Tax=Purpureocillium lilacinum TaxID=33203 RepID=A0ACC4DN58_PURLI